MWNFTHLFPLDVPGTVHPGQSDITARAGRNRMKDSPMGCAGVNIAQAHEQATEQRFCRRFELVSPVSFRWHDASEHYKVGYCTNLGLGGIFVIASECPAKGTHVRLEVLIRPFDPVGGLRLKCSGHVVRIQAGDQVSGFAVAGRFEDEIARKSLCRPELTVRSVDRGLRPRSLSRKLPLGLK